MKYDSETLAHILAHIITYSRADGIDDPRTQVDAEWHCAFICSCFLAQNTRLGQDGVSTETAFDALNIETDMSYDERLELVRSVIKEFE